MRVHVTTDMSGSPDGNTVIKYKAGHTYTMPAELAAVFVREGWGREVKASKPNSGTRPKPRRAKMLRRAPEDK